MRLAITFPLALDVPGGGTHDCRQIALHLARAGVEVTLFSASSPGPGRFPRARRDPGRETLAKVEEPLREAGVELVRVPAHPLHYLLDGLPMKRALGRSESRFDAILSYWHEARFLGEVAAKRGALLAMNAAASYAPIFRSSGRIAGLPKRLQGRVFVAPPLRAARVVFARSKFARDEVTAYAGVDPARVRIVHCGVDPFFAEVERPDEPEEEITRILFFGRFEPAKGIFDALDALGRVASGGSRRWTLRVVGWGDPDRVRGAAREHGIEGRVEVLDALDHPALRRQLAWAQLALLPSHTESFGLANAESQAAGVPVVAYGVAAVPEVVEDGVTGWLVPPGRVDQLAEALETALADPAATHAAGLAGRERVTRMFTWERAAAATIEGLEAAR